METLTNNIENFKRDAAEFFGGSDLTNFKYQVATNFVVYDTDNVEYKPGDFSLSLLNLVDKNPYTQLTEVFPDYYYKSISEHITDQVNASVHFTASDAGSVKIGNDEFTILIPNGYGDGTTEVIVTSGSAHVPLRFSTTVQGRFNIYLADTSDAIQAELDGKYSVYAQDQTVVFEKNN